MAFKTMEATVKADKANRTVEIIVEHDIRQSYSRAVKPRAFKAYKRWASENIMFGKSELVAVNYDYGFAENGRPLAYYKISY